MTLDFKNGKGDFFIGYPDESIDKVACKIKMSE